MERFTPLFPHGSHQKTDLTVVFSSKTVPLHSGHENKLLPTLQNPMRSAYNHSSIDVKTLGKMLRAESMVFPSAG